MAIETELKLHISPAHLLRLKRHPFLRSLTGEKPITRKLHSIYFDTPELYFHHHEMALRLRRVGKQWGQTLKGGGSVHAGLHQRNEWESLVPNQQLDLAELELQGATYFPPDLINHLQPLFVTEFKRTIYLVKYEGALIELSIDSGEVRAGKLVHEISEVELELKSGESLSLFRLALALLDVVPLEIEATSKAEYGFRLLHPPKAIVIKARIPELSAEIDVKCALQDMVWSCLLHLQENVAGTVGKSDDEYLHQVRVALRRLRIVLKMISRLRADPELASLQSEVAELASILGTSREWDVFVTQTLPACDLSDAEAKALIKQSELIRRQQHQQLDAILKKGKLQRLLLQVGAWMNGRYWSEDPPHQKLLKFAPKIFQQYKRKVLQFSEKINSHSEISELHVLRIACKNLRYSIELFASLYATKKIRRYLNALIKLQEVLGEINDHVVALQLLAKIGKPTRQKLIARLSDEIEHGHDRRLKKLRKKWTQFANQQDFWT
ncbi:MAG: CHAD domain-containing protein [Gallionellaceae bacterium]